MIRVVIADDQHLIRRAIRMLIESEGGIQVVGEANNGIEAVQMTRDLAPDVLVIDINMPLLDGIEATRQITQLKIATRVLVLSMYSDGYTVLKALRSGASGYALKGSVPQELITAIYELGKGGVFISPETEGVTLKGGLPVVIDKEVEQVDNLTEREKEVFRLIAEGLSNSQIAAHLFISIKTVEKHRTNLMKKLDVHDTASLVRKAVQYKMVMIER